MEKDCYKQWGKRFTTQYHKMPFNGRLNSFGAFSSILFIIDTTFLLTIENLSAITWHTLVVRNHTHNNFVCFYEP